MSKTSRPGLQKYLLSYFNFKLVSHRCVTPHTLKRPADARLQTFLFQNAIIIENSDNNSIL